LLFKTLKNDSVFTPPRTRCVSLSTGKNGYGETVIRPYPEEGRVALRTELHSHLLWP
jgi:hypothetical protein